MDKININLKQIRKVLLIICGMCGMSISTCFLSSCSLPLPRFFDGYKCFSTNSYSDGGGGGASVDPPVIKPSTPQGSTYIWYYFSSNQGGFAWDKTRFGYDLSQFDNNNLFINPKIDFPSQQDFQNDPPVNSATDDRNSYTYNLLLFRFQITYNGLSSSQPHKPDGYWHSCIAFTYHNKSWNWDYGYYSGPSVDVSWDSSWWSQ